MTTRTADAHLVLTFRLNDTTFAATGSDRP
jgi:hypothetical protein